MRVGSVAGALVLLTQGLAMVPANAAPDASLAWVQKSLDLKAYEGTSNTQSLELTFSGNPTNPSATIDGNLREVAAVDLSVPAITSDGHASVKLTINLPAQAKDSYVGNIQLMENGKPLPQPLHIAVTRTQADSQTIPDEPQMPSPDRIGTVLGMPATVDVLNIQLTDSVADPDALIKALASARGAQIVAGISELRYYELRFPGATTDSLAAVKAAVTSSTGVEAVSYAVLSSSDSLTNDPETWGSNPNTQTDANWNLRQIDAPTAWDTTTGANTVAGILDSGFYTQHEDLSPKIVRSGGSLSAAPNHGTHVAGTACAAGDNRRGVVGVAYSCSLNVQGLGWEKDLPEGILLKGIQRIAESTPRPRVVNISYGAESESNCAGPGPGRAAVRDELKSMGATLAPTLRYFSSILWVFSAGNSGYDSACSAYGNLGNRIDLPNVMTVAASTIDGTQASYSVRGSGVTVAAPGGDLNASDEVVHGIRSTYPYQCTAWGLICGDKYANLSGTSMAAPHVTGTAALAFSANDKLRPADVKQCLVDGAAAGGKHISGQAYSIINAKKSVDCALGQLNQTQGKLTNVQSIVANEGINYALKKDGTVWSWGDNSMGELGNDTFDRSSTPVQVFGLTEVSTVIKGGVSGGNAGFALKKDGTLWAWGFNGYGALGEGAGLNSPTPVQVPGLPHVVSAASGGGANFAAGSDGSVWSWGYDQYETGQLGLGQITGTGNSGPIRVGIPEPVASVYMGNSTGYALTTKGTVWSWGDNSHGQLGNGTTEASGTPAEIPGLAGVSKLVTTSGNTVYALMADQTLKVWGEGSGGALGNGTFNTSLVPITVPNVSAVAEVVSDSAHTFARLTTGRILAWGDGTDGVLGTGSTTKSAVPTPVSGISNAVAVATDGHSTLGLLSDGTVRAWGLGWTGFLGTASTAKSNPTPVTVNGISGVASIAASTSAAYAVKADGTAWSWGANPSLSQLGRLIDYYYYDATPALI